MNNPFATQAQPVAASGNPFAAVAGTAAGANPFAAVTTPPGVQAIEQAFGLQQAFGPPGAAVSNPFAPVVGASVGNPVAPPLNPPGEAGLGLAPAAVAAPVAPVTAPAVPPVVEPEPAPRARRGRKPKAAEASAEIDAGRGDVRGAVDAAVRRDRDADESQGIDLLACTTEELVQALKSRGYSVTLKDG